MKRPLLKKKSSGTLALYFSMLIGLLSCVGNSEVYKTENALRIFIGKYEEKVKPLLKDLNAAQYKALVSGRPDDYRHSEELRIKLIKEYSNREDFFRFKALMVSQKIQDPILRAQLDVLFNDYLYYQINSKRIAQLIKASTEVDRNFSIHRASLNGRRVSDGYIDSVLVNSTDRLLVKEAWKASKQVGDSIATDLLALVKLRNEAAKSLGFEDFRQLMFNLNEISPAKTDQLFYQMDSLTREPYRLLKQDLDAYLSDRFQVSVDSLRPWHYQGRFFQHMPPEYNVGLNRYFEKRDIVAITSEFYRGMGLDIDDVLVNSSLYEEEGKAQHSYTFDVDREGDVRILANISFDKLSMNALLYEAGFAASYKYINPQLPFALRQPTHYFVSDAVGIFMSQFASEPYWLETFMDVPRAQLDSISGLFRKSMVQEKLVFSRWMQVMYHFEKGLYENPDQDLNQLWWALVERYQMLTKPDDGTAEWATKVHLVTSPCTYQNYMLGELFAAQLQSYILTDLIRNSGNDIKSCINNTLVGYYLKQEIMRHGRSKSWVGLVKSATGTPLSTEYYKKLYLAE